MSTTTAVAIAALQAVLATGPTPTRSQQVADTQHQVTDVQPVARTGWIILEDTHLSAVPREDLLPAIGHRAYAALVPGTLITFVGASSFFQPHQSAMERETAKPVLAIGIALILVGTVVKLLLPSETFDGTRQDPSRLLTGQEQAHHCAETPRCPGGAAKGDVRIKPDDSWAPGHPRKPWRADRLSTFQHHLGAIAEVLPEPSAHGVVSAGDGSSSGCR